MPESCGDAPSPDEIRAAIERITASDVFCRSPQLGAFLRFVADAVLNGKADRIKAYTIGIEVLRRDDRFDPQLDPIVRVEATRLRRAIERYYAGPGIDDFIIVDLPRGTYVPTFRRREPVPAVGLVWAGWSGVVLQRPLLAAVAALVAVTAIVAGVMLSRIGTPRDALAAATVRDLVGWPLGRSLPPGNGMPTILIEQPRIVGSAPAGGIASDTLFEKIGDAFARFDTVNVVYAPHPAEAMILPHADYRLAGAVEYKDGKPCAQFRLVDVVEGKVVWSRSFERLDAGHAGAAEDEIVRVLTEALLQSYGVVRARDRAKHLASRAGDPRYRCILEAADSFRTQNRSEHDRARACLENLTAADPSFAVGYAFLSLLYGREHQFGFAGLPGEPRPLDRALAAVRRSIELNPASSRAYVVLMVVLFHRGEVAKAFAAGDQSIALNQYDMLGPAEYGGRLILVGEVEKGMALLRQAGEFGAIRPSWHHFYMFMGAYLGGDLQEAAYQSGQMTADNYSATHLARTLLAIAAGDMERASQSFERLAALQPGWRKDPKAELARLTPNPNVAKRLAGELARIAGAGL